MPPPGACRNIMAARHKQNGHGTPTNPEKFLNQDFVSLKKFCLINGLRYLDDLFPPDSNSIGQGILKPADLARVEWLRPAQIAPNADFVVDGFSRFDFGQGILGNCWFLASIGALTFQKHIFQQVVPLDQTLKEDYCGIFHFRFWRFGRWVDVVIDDKLPTINRSLIFVHSKDPNEFWPALLEKAYAKVCGSYTDMNSGTPSEAMMDFTGGVHMCIQLSDSSADAWGLMCRAGKSNTLMGCGTAQGETPANTILPNGLVQGHAYTVTGVIELLSQGKRVRLVRLWNPWGKGEWKGDWSDLSPMWSTVSSEDRHKCLSVADDGEFWMTFEDLCKFYTDVDICGLKPDFIDGKSSDQWKTCVYEGRWVAGTTAGGCINNKDSFWTNPQYRIKVVAENLQTDDEKNILVSLMQKPDKRNRRLVQNLHIGFSIYSVNISLCHIIGKFPASFFGTQLPVARSEKYMNAREVIEFLTLKPGEYLIVPSTFKPNETASFILTIHSKAKTSCYKSNQLTFQYEEVDAEQLQRILNDNILKGLDCKNSVKLKLKDSSVCPLLNGAVKYCVMMVECCELHEILCRLIKGFIYNINSYCVCLSGLRVGDDILSLMAVRYGASSGHMSVESFISLMIRLDCMKSK
uniref:Calpain catalytic domain-containing protein n=1 Tax=Amphilophus citrinellus TaxID=61819 RepID=A0A3Q0R274_AMPCI